MLYVSFYIALFISYLYLLLIILDNSLTLLDSQRQNKYFTVYTKKSLMLTMHLIGTS